MELLIFGIVFTLAVVSRVFLWKPRRHDLKLHRQPKTESIFSWFHRANWHLFSVPSSHELRQVPAFQHGLPVKLESWNRLIIIGSNQVEVVFTGLNQLWRSNYKIPISEYDGVYISRRHYDDDDGDETVEVQVTLAHRYEDKNNITLREDVWRAADDPEADNQELKPTLDFQSAAASALKLPIKGTETVSLRAYSAMHDGN